MAMTPEEKTIEEILQKHPELRGVAKIICDEQWKYAAEPVLARTGKGFLQSEGVSEMSKIKTEGSQEASGGKSR